jgi:hypothetical protein
MISLILLRRMVRVGLILEIEHLYVNPNEESQEYSLYEPDNEEEIELQVRVLIYF